MASDDADELVESIVMVARSLNKHSAPHFIGLGDLKVMITTQEEHGDGLSWWIRLMHNGNSQVIQSWHAEGSFGLMNAATQLSMRVYPFKRKLL